VCSGVCGVIEASHVDGAGRVRRVIGYIGEDGLEPDVRYVIEAGTFVKAVSK